MKCTLVIKSGKDGFLIGQLKEFPEVFTQGLTINEVKENISDVLEMYFEDLREKYEPQGEMVEVSEIINILISIYEKDKIHKTLVGASLHRLSFI
jgi:predicted RNase H-like HicB family nuclease